MKTRKQSAHRIVKKLFDDLYDRVPESSNGTYNRQDPTHYSKGSAQAIFRWELFEISYNDCTWGVEWEIKKWENLEIGDNKGYWRNRQSRDMFWGKWNYVGGYYDSRDSEGIIWRTANKGGLKLLKTLLHLLPEHSKMEEYMNQEFMEPDPMGCLADYV